MTGIIERDACWATTCFMNKSIRKIIAFSLKNKYFILFVTALLIIYGIITFRNMSIEAFPDVTNTEITIITQWPGRSVEEVEKFVTIPIEIGLNSVLKKRASARQVYLVFRWSN
jgi:cobalt-zinc-cadmium resistance protein CzcA